MKANDLTNELEVKKDKMIESYQRKREQLIEEGLTKIHQLQNEEKKKFNKKIEQLRRDFYKKHYEKYNQEEKKLEDTLKDFTDANQIENQNQQLYLLLHILKSDQVIFDQKYHQHKLNIFHNFSNFLLDLT